jgi:hypothetical protein
MDEKPTEFGEEFSKFPLKKRRFLERYAETASIAMASRHAGVSRRTHLNWRKKDRRFEAACHEALESAIDEIEAEARRRAKDGILEPVYYGGKAVGAVRTYSDTLLMFLLKAARPEKYRDNYSGFSEPPRANREEIIKGIQDKLARLAAQHTPPRNEGPSV